MRLYVCLCVIYATVTHSQISTRVHTELKPYQSASIVCNKYRSAGRPFDVTVTHSRISNRAHTELKPYQSASTRIDPHRHPCQLLIDSGATIRRRKSFGHVQKFLQGFQFRMDSRLDPARPALTRLNPQCKTVSTLVVYRYVSHDGYWQVLYRGRYGSKRVDRGQKGYLSLSIRIMSLSTLFDPYWPVLTKTVLTLMDPYRPRFKHCQYPSCET